MYECFHCGERLVIWDNDFNSEDYGYEPGGLIHACHCEGCGALITYLLLPDEEETSDEDK